MHTSLSRPERPGVSGNLRLNRGRSSFPFVAVTWGVLGGSILRTSINTSENAQHVPGLCWARCTSGKTRLCRTQLRRQTENVADAQR